MAQPTLNVIVDHQQKRLWQSRMSRIDVGEEFLNSAFIEDVFVDSITGTAMLMPQVYDPDWNTTTSGRFARLTKTNFTFEDDSIWVDHELRLAGDTWLHSLGPQNQVVRTSQTYQKNRGFFVGFFQYNVSNEVSMIFECGWGDGPDASDLYLQFWSDGFVGVVRDGDTTRYANDEGDTISGRDDSGAQNPTQAMQPQRFWECILLPCRKKELLVLSNQGGGFKYILDDLDEDSDVEDIVNGGLLYDNHNPFDVHKSYNSSRQFWFRAPNAQATVQVVPLNFPTSGYMTSKVHEWNFLPNEDEDPEYCVFADPPGFGTSDIDISMCDEDDPLIDVAGEARFRTKVSFTGDGNCTEFFNGCEVSYPPIFAETEPAEVDITQYVTKVSLSVPDDASGVEAEIEFRGAIEVDGDPVTLTKIVDEVPQFMTLGNRPIKLLLDDQLILDGRTDKPRWTDGIDERAQKGSLTIRDGFKAYDHTFTVDPIVLDYRDEDENGATEEIKTVADAFKFLLKNGGAGITHTAIDGAVSATAMPRSSSPGRIDSWSLEMRVGDAWASWIQRLHEDFCATHLIGLKPDGDNIIFYAKARPTAEEHDDPVYDLWLTNEESKAGWEASGETATEAHRLSGIKATVRNYSEDTLEPEANLIYVTGFDPRDRKPMQAFKSNPTSVDPAVAPSARDANWIGEERRYGFGDSTLCRQALINSCCDLLADRLFPARTIASIDCGLLIDFAGLPVWRGDVVTVHGKGTFWISSFSVDFVKMPDNENSDTWEHQNGRYVLELLTREEE